MDLKENGHHGPNLIELGQNVLHVYVAYHHVATLVRADLFGTISISCVPLAAILT